jgi:hypothetical protein
MISDDSSRKIIRMQVSEREGLVNGVPPRDKPIKGGWIRNIRKNNMLHIDMIKLPGGGYMNDTIIL